MRIKVLAKHGHEDPRLLQLDTAMTKLDAVKALAKADEFQDTFAQSAIADYLDRKDTGPAVKAAVTPVKAKAPTKVKAPKAAKATAPATAGMDENIPF
jgi:hypothetical protein